MTDWIYAASICAVVFAYWVFCRNNAIKHQEEAVTLLEKYLSDEKISEKEKSKMHFNYRLFRFWFALPLVLLSGPFFIIVAFASKKFSPADIAKENSEQFDEVFGALMQMYIAKNPLIATVTMSFFVLFYVVIAVIGTVLNKASNLPSATKLASGITEKILNLRQRIAH